MKHGVIHGIGCLELLQRAEVAHEPSVLAGEHPPAFSVRVARKAGNGGIRRIDAARIPAKNVHGAVLLHRLDMISALPQTGLAAGRRTARLYHESPDTLAPGGWWRAPVEPPQSRHLEFCDGLAGDAGIGLVCVR